MPTSAIVHAVTRELPVRASKPALVVSGDEAVRQAYMALLRGSGWSAMGASTCDEALRIVERIRVRVVLFDIVTGPDWFQCRRLREALPDAPLVVLTATCTPDRWYRGVAQRIGCAGFVMKPCAPGAIVDALQRTCAGEGWVEYVPAEAT